MRVGDGDGAGVTCGWSGNPRQVRVVVTTSLEASNDAANGIVATAKRAVTTAVSPGSIGACKVHVSVPPVAVSAPPR